MVSLVSRWRARGADRFDYAPRRNGRPDIGEVCWAWVPFEEDDSQGKDRPVLIVGRRRRQWLALMLTSRDRADQGATTEDQFGRVWLDIGIGAWDQERRPSEVRLDRLLVLRKVRREGSAVDGETFARVLAHGRPLWSS